MKHADLIDVSFDNFFLDLSYQWLQEDKVLKELTVTPELTKVQQIQWYNSLSQKKGYIIRGLEVQGTKIGAFGIKNITNHCGEYWGYIADREYWGKGYGKLLMEHAFELAKKLKLEELFLYVKNIENIRAIKLYLSVGFEFEEKGKDYVKMRKKLHYDNKGVSK